MQVFEVYNTIETRLIEGNKIGDILSPEKVYIISDDDARVIYINQGEHAPLVLYLIAKKIAKDLRVFLKGFYSIKELDSNEAIESIKSALITTTGKIPQIIRENSPIESKNFENINQTPNGDQISPIDISWRENLTYKELSIFQNVKLTETMKEIQQLPKIPNYRSELVLIGHTMYTLSQDLARFLKNYQTEAKMMKLGPLPEGLFFVEGYTSRLIIKNGRLQALEFLKPMNNIEKSGKINAPLLNIPRIMLERSIDLLQQSFHIPEDPPLDSIIAQAKEHRRAANQKGANDA
jgi:hypothetical protein